MAQENLTPAQREARKSEREHAEDTAYVINHALSCGTTDTFIQPFAGAFVQEKIEHGRWPESLSWLGKIFESPDAHGHGHHHDHHHSPNLRGNLSHWFLGEAAGDFLAVPLTVMVQRRMPWLTHLMRKIMEPFVGKYFHRGAHRDAKKWANQAGAHHDSRETLAHEAMLYDNEMRHLPLAVIWNMFSIPINLAAQKLSGSKASWGTLLVGKAFGSIFSNTVLLTGRALAPAAFEKWDSFNSKHVILPATKAVGKVFGVKDTPEDKVETYHQEAREKEKEARNWVERTQATPTELSRYH